MISPLRLSSEAALAVLHTAAAAALAGWQRAFCPAGASDDHVSAWSPLVLAPAAAVPAAHACWRDGQRRMWIELTGDGDGAALLAARLFGEPAGAGAVLAPALGAHAFKALGAALAGALLPITAASPRAGSEVLSGPLEIDCADLGAVAGAASCQVRIGTLMLRCILSGEAVAALAPRAPARPLPALPAVALLDLLRDVPVRLRIEAGAAHVGAGSLLECGPGDMVRLDTAISAPLRVLAPGGATLFYGFLGRVGEHSAVEITQHF